MADLTEIQTALQVKIVGSDATGSETNEVNATSNGLQVDVQASVLPTGAATAALQTTGNTSLASIDTKTPALVSGRQPVDGSGVTQPISAASLPLPSGASTSALQTTGNSSLSSIDTKTPALGQALAAGSTPVVLTAAQLTTLTPLTSVTVTQSTAANLNATVSIAATQTLANVTTLGTITNALPTGSNTIGSISNISGTISLPTGASTSALQTTGNTSLSSIDTKTPALGQALAAGSVPVVLTAAQLTTLTPLSTVTVNQGTSPWVGNTSQFGGSAVVTGTGTSGAGIPRVTVSTDSNILATQSGTWNINNISGTVSLPTGASTSALQTTGNTSLASIDTKTPTLGQKTMANSSPVVIASDQSALPIQLATISLTNFAYDDMNVANGGIARATNLTAGVATTLYSYTGAGSIYGFILNLASLTAGGGFQIDLIVDGGHVFGSSGINTIDLSGNTVYDIGNIAADTFPTLGWRFVDKSVRWEVPGGGQVKFSTSVVLKVTWVTGAAQKFNAGMIALIKGP